MIRGSRLGGNRLSRLEEALGFVDVVPRAVVVGVVRPVVQVDGEGGVRVLPVVSQPTGMGMDGETPSLRRMTVGVLCRRKRMMEVPMTDGVQCRVERIRVPRLLIGEEKRMVGEVSTSWDFQETRPFRQLALHMNTSGCNTSSPPGMA